MAKKTEFKKMYLVTTEFDKYHLCYVTGKVWKLEHIKNLEGGIQPAISHILETINDCFAEFDDTVIEAIRIIFNGCEYAITRQTTSEEFLISLFGDTRGNMK